MSFRTRLLLTSLTTLAVGLGALVVAGNVLLDRRVQSESTNLLSAHVQAQLATLAVTSSGITIREAPNDELLDRRAWILDGDTILERAANVSPALSRQAIALGRARDFGDHEGPDDILFRVAPIAAPAADRPPALPPPSMGCWPASPPRGVMSSALPARSPTSCAPRSRGSAAAPSSG